VCSEKWAIWTLLLSPQDFDLKGLTIVTEPLSMQQMIKSWSKLFDLYGEAIKTEAGASLIPKGIVERWDVIMARKACADEASAVLARLRELSAKWRKDFNMGRDVDSAVHECADELDAISGEKHV
jgi:beta-phosphoglucomutase-like phosphatase (HAD superfamily)